MDELTTPGKLIDSIVRSQHRHHKRDGLTEFIKDLAKDSGLSERQIARMRQDTDFPNGETLGKLIRALPELEILNIKNICHRLLLPFKTLQIEQEKLANLSHQNQDKNKITIIAGWQKPEGLRNTEVAKSIAHNINQGFRYEFIFPDLSNHPQKERDETEKQLTEWRRDLILTVGHIWKEKIITEIISKDSSKAAQIHGTQKIANTLQENINFISTSFHKKPTESSQKLNNNKTQFWLLLPSNYVVFYNLNLNSNSSGKFGNFLIKGILHRNPENSPKFSQIKTEGWLYVSEEIYKLIEQEYKKNFNFWTSIELNEIDIKIITDLL